MSHEGKDLCHECKYMSIADRRALLDLNTSDSEISCSFYNFRKLTTNKSKTKIEVAGYLDPQRDATTSDLTIWQKSLTLPTFVDTEKAKFALGLIGDQFCEMVKAETKMKLETHNSENKTLVWKPAVKGVREMCDVCKTTIFDHHWICSRCGVFVCPDCYQVSKDFFERFDQFFESRTSEKLKKYPSLTHFFGPKRPFLTTIGSAVAVGFLYV